jgi:hypothetical protein
MKNIIDKFKRYSFQEWFALVIGVIIWTVQVYRYITNTLSDSNIELVVFAIGGMLLFQPLMLLNLIRKARGIEIK